MKKRITTIFRNALHGLIPEILFFQKDFDQPLVGHRRRPMLIAAWKQRSSTAAQFASHSLSETQSRWLPALVMNFGNSDNQRGTLVQRTGSRKKEEIDTADCNDHFSELKFYNLINSYKFKKTFLKKLSFFENLLKILAPTSPRADSGSSSAADSIWIIWIMKSTRSRKNVFAAIWHSSLRFNKKCREHIFYFQSEKKGRQALLRNRRRARKILNKIPLSEHVVLISRKFYKRHVLETWARNFLQAFYFNPVWARLYFLSLKFEKTEF